ncbi:MAG TPA: hypothetical protein VHC93_18700 [Methylomirabilota bacterium]|nr:hypothetical protein [Methylomirabilota bacterium]
MTRLLVVWLALLLRVGCLLVFPALAVWAWRAGGGRRLWALTAAALGAVLLFAAFAASATGGNALVETHGYSYTLPGSLVLHGLTLGLPMVAASLAVRGAGGRVTSRVALYALGLLVALLGWVAGIVAATGVVYGVMR